MRICDKPAWGLFVSLKQQLEDGNAPEIEELSLSAVKQIQEFKVVKANETRYRYKL